MNWSVMFSTFLQVCKTEKVASLVRNADNDLPLGLWKFVILLVFFVAIEMENALDEMLREHNRVPLQ